MKLNRNKALAVLASFLILTTAIGIGVWSNGWPSTVTITPQSMTSPYSYIVSIDGPTVYMKNGTTGQVEYTSTNASKVFLFIIGNLSATARSIFAKAGTYLIDTEITVAMDDFQLTGEGPSTELRASAAINSILNIKNARFAWINNIFLNGYGLATKCIDASHAPTYVPVHNIENCRVWGATSYGIDLSGCEDVTLRSVWFDGRKTQVDPVVVYTDYGLYVNGGAGNLDLFGCKFMFLEKADAYIIDIREVKFYGALFASKYTYSTALVANVILQGGGTDWVQALFDGCWFDGEMGAKPNILIANYRIESLTLVECEMKGTDAPNIYSTLDPALTSLTILGGRMVRNEGGYRVDVNASNVVTLNTVMAGEGIILGVNLAWPDRYLIIDPGVAYLNLGNKLALRNEEGIWQYATNGTLVPTIRLDSDDVLRIFNQAGLGSIEILSFISGGRVKLFNSADAAWLAEFDGNWTRFVTLAGDANTTGWGNSERGQFWFNLAEGRFKYWTGTLTQTMMATNADLGYEVSPYSYLVYTNGTHYFMKSGVDGQIKYSSANASKVLDFAAGNITDGSVFLRSGSYDLSTMSSYIQTAGKNLEIVGENWDSTILIDSRSGATRMIGATASATPTGNLTIRNIKFDRRATPDVDAKYCVYGSWLNVWIEHCRFIGNVTLADSTTSHFNSVPFSGNIATDYTTNVVFINNYVLDFQYGCVPVHCTYSKQTGNYIENAATWALGAATAGTNNGQYIVSDNTLINCAWYDEGIAIDSVNPASSVDTNSLIADNVIFNDASHPLVGGIKVVTANGVTVHGNKITNFRFDSSYWGEIGVDGRDSCSITNLTITDNEIFTLSHRGMELRGVCGGTISGNTIRYGNATAGSLGIRMTWTKSITYAAGLIYMTDNDIYLSGSSASNVGFELSQTAGAGGAVKILMDGNTVTAAKGMTTDIDAVVTVTLGGGNWFNCTTGVTDSGSVATVYAATHSQVYMGGSSSNLGTDNATIQYVPLPYKGSPSTGTDRQTIILFTGTISHARVYLYAAPGTNAWRNATLYVNGVATTLTVNITGANTAGIDFTHEVAVTAGDRVQWAMGCGNLAAVPTASMVDVSCEYEWVEGTS